MKPSALLPLFLTTILFAQTAPEVEITAEPHHHLALTNDQVRVFKVDVPPHTDTRMHWHRHDYMYVQLGAAEVVNAVKGKAPVTIKLQDGQTGFTHGGFAHIARNPSDQPFRNVTIEILQDDKLRRAAQSRGGHWDPAHPDEDRGLNILQGGTQEILWVNDGIRASEIELQPGGILPEGRHPAAQLLVAISDLDLRGAAPGTEITLIHLKSGDVKWFRARLARQLTNTGHVLAKFVTLEFPGL